MEELVVHTDSKMLANSETQSQLTQFSWLYLGPKVVCLKIIPKVFFISEIHKVQSLKRCILLSRVCNV